MTLPFAYPPSPHEQRHGPQGYADAASYRPWLRDEFCFRCVYCLLREQWSRHGFFGIDHFFAAAHFPAKATDYDNLLYACATCNAAKRDLVLPDPLKVLISGSVRVMEDGTIRTDSKEAAQLIETLGLDSPQSSEFRMLWLGIIALAAKHDVDLYRKLMGFPDDLPDLSRLRPPAGNLRAKGIEKCWYARKQQGTLPEIY